MSISAGVYAQKKKASPKPKTQATPTETELSKLRDEYVKATKEYKASLQKLLTLYQDNLKRAEERRGQMQQLLADGLVSQREVEQSDTAVSEATLKVTSVEQQIAGADTRIKYALV